MAEENSEGLFRSEAVRFRAARLQGEVWVRIRLPWLLLGLVASGLVLSLVICLCFVSFHQTANASGSIVPAEGITWLTSQGPGIIDHVLVRDGEEVRAGQALVRLRPASPQGESYTLDSPASMIVGVIAVHPGQVISSDDTVIALLPNVHHLEAELFITRNAIGLIKAGQPVLLRYDAFSSRTYGPGRGKILSVSLLPLAPREVATLGNVASEPVYKATVSLEQDFVSAHGEPSPLRPGMSLRAQVIVEEHTMLQWLLDQFHTAGRP